MKHRDVVLGMNAVDCLEKARRLIGSVLLNHPCTLSEAVRLQEALLKIELALESISDTSR
jgi:hypothetical protein